MSLFHSVTLADRVWMNPLIHRENSQSADHNFSNIYMWDGTYHQEVAELYGCLGIRLGYSDQPFYAYPIGKGDTGRAISALRTDAATHGTPLQLRGILKEQLSLLEQMFPGEFTVKEDRFVFDYLYSAEKLATLSGKKLQSKRNHINRFVEHCPNWNFAPVTPDNIHLCREFQRAWLTSHTDRDSAELMAEDLALTRCFDNFEALGMEGGLLLDGETVLAFTFGEPLNADTYIVHFEKASSDVQGAYPMINREFVRYISERHPEMLFINREDDTGLENLRKAKLSYCPERFVEKYTATWVQP